LNIQDLQEGDTNDTTIRCSLEYCPLDSGSGFGALSYVWGHGSPSSQIIVDGQPFSVTDNLCDALRNIRSRWKKVKTWIDAICVNQKDAEEKTERVWMMRNIYSQAFQVLIWMGQASPRDATGLEFAGELWAS
ncbi:heterokaryon incompatibility protein-domain-containing protein, partial [Immersiella caudata]